MKKITFLLLGLLMITSASADEYQYSPLVKEGKKWVEYYENTMDFTSGIIYYQFKGETEINGVTYHNLYATLNSDKIANETTPIAYVREQDRKVFAIVNESNVVDFPQGYYPLEIDRCQYDASSNEFFIYDFNDITSPYDASGFAGDVNISQTDVNGQMVNIYSVPSNEIIYFDDEGMDKHEFVVQEAVGTLHEVFINPWPFYPTNGLHFNLAWVEDNGQYLYKGAFYDKAIQLVEQEYVPLVREGVVWEYVEYNSKSGILPDAASIYTLEFNGVCEEGHKLYRTDYNADGTSNEPYLVAYVNEANKVVTLNIDDNLPYYLNVYTSEFDKIYDFNNNDLYFLPEEAAYFSYQLADVSGAESFTVEVGNTTRNGYHVNFDAQHDVDLKEFKIIEGIGVDCMYGDLLEPFRNFPTSIYGWTMAGLSAVYENGELVYQGCLYDEAQQLKNPEENEYVPLVREGVVWEYVGFRQDGDNPRNTLYTLEFIGTTEINGLVYHNVYRTDYDEQGNAQEPYLVTYVREENKVVTVYNYTDAEDEFAEDEFFYYNYWWWVPKTLYDFSKPMFLPDEANMAFGYIPDDYNTNYSSIEVEVGGTTRKGYYIDNGIEYYSFKTIEGIGVDCNFGDLLVPYRNYWTGFNPMAGLAAVYENGELVYKGCKYNRAQSLKKDVDGDGAVTAADVTALYDFMLNSSEYDYNEMYDVDGDNQVTAADITAIYNVILGEQ